MSWEVCVEMAGGTFFPLCQVHDIFALFAVLESLIGPGVTGPQKIQINVLQ